ncbi:choice-of-anchor Q domain-containing protein [Candidatus Leptofilum sp.]|uniref:choice-of-anchor Q domain-containing protein n=1 Tax=Candidatus Leptofilum sp. TaxID=3241576 RepID=UPI003B5B1B5C
MKHTRLLLAIAIPIILLSFFLTTLQTKASPSATFTVNSTVDAVDVNPGDGVCETAVANECTLRAAVMETNSLVGADQINLPRETYTRTIGGIGEDASAGDLNITEDLRIIGESSTNTIINGNALDRIFIVSNGAELVLENIAIYNGVSPGGGGGIFIEEGTNVTILSSRIISNSAGSGGGIASRGLLTITNSLISNNISDGSGGGLENLSPLLMISNSTISGNIGSRGAGIFTTHDGIVEIVNSTLSHNFSDGEGGAITNLGPTMSLTNVTISNNHVDFRGGAIDNHSTLTATNSTIVSNTASLSIGGIYNNIINNGVIYLQNTLVAFNSNGNCGGNSDDIISLGYNLEDANLCNLNAIGDIVNQNPLIDSLKNYGGNTLSHTLFPESPAIDAANPNVCPPNDQRYFSRPFDGDNNGTSICDIGAVEYGSSPMHYVYLPIIVKP